MNLLDIALEIAERIPVSLEYRDEREFAWLALGTAATVVEAEDLQRLALDRLGASRTGAELRLKCLQCRNDIRSEILRELFEHIDRWEDFLFRRELSDLALTFCAEYGITRTSAAASRLGDAFTRATFLVEVASLTNDVLVRRSVLMQSWGAANEVGGDRDYALKWVAGGFLKAGLVGEAHEVIATMTDPSIRLDFLDALKDTLARSGQGDAAAGVLAQRDQIQAEHSDTIPQSEMLEQAHLLISQDIHGNPLPAVFADIEAQVRSGSAEEAVARIRSEFPTRVCPAAWRIDPGLLERLILFQLSAVQGYGRNDLKIEFVTDLVVAFHRNGNQAPPPLVLAAASTDAFLKIEPAAPPSITSRDPSTMTLAAFTRFLFDRPVAGTIEEERFMRRARDDDPDVSDKTALVRLATELFQKFGKLVDGRTHEQVDQAMWFLNGYPFFLKDLWMNDRVPASAVRECVEACYNVFADFVDVTRLPESATSFFMWWDERWMSGSPTLITAVLETLDRILALPSWACRNAALYGLSHLHPHPAARRSVEAFLERHHGQLSNDDVQYALACRDGREL
jgi:hypothetical protein